MRYGMGMSERSRYLPAVRCGQVLLLVAPRSFLKQALPPWAARLAFSGPLRVLDGGGRFNPYSLARPLRRLTPQVAEAMQRVHIQRAFTCYQMAALLDEIGACDKDAIPPNHGGMQATPPNHGGMQATPLLALDLLNTFQDEDVAAHERRRLLAGGLARLNRLSQIAPVAVTVALHSAGRHPGGHEPRESAGTVPQKDTGMTPRESTATAPRKDDGMRWLEALEAGLENARIWWFDGEPIPPPPPTLF